MSTFDLFKSLGSIIASAFVLILFGPVVVECWQDFIYPGKKIKEEPDDALLF